MCFNGNLYLENVYAYLNEVAKNPILILFAVLIAISCGIFNLLSVKIINAFNGLARSVIEPLTMLLVWIIGIILTLAIDKNSVYGN